MKPLVRSRSAVRHTDYVTLDCPQSMSGRSRSPRGALDSLHAGGAQDIGDSLATALLAERQQQRER